MNSLDIRYSYRGSPTLQAFARSNAFIRGLMGPFGSGKSSACIAEFPTRALEQKPGPDGIRRTRWAVVRNTYRELEDSTIRSFHEWLPPRHFGRWYVQDKRYVIQAFEKTEFEILFRALDDPDDVKKLLSTEFTGAWVNEAREVPWTIVDALCGRIGRYPAMMNGGPTWFGLWMDTNPPDVESEWYSFFEDRGWLRSFDEMIKQGVFPKGTPPEDYAHIFKQPSGRAPNAENLPNLVPGYYHRLSVGKKKDWIKVYVDGDYGFITSDKLVYPEYSDALHCQEIEPVEGITIVRGWDFGLCVDDITEALTDKGWKLFKDVDVETDTIATRDPSTGALEYAKAAFKVAEPYKGKMLEWAGSEINFCVTPEHRVPFTKRNTPRKVRWSSAQWIADHIGARHYVDLCSTWRANEQRGAHWIDKGDGYGLEEPTVFAAFMGLYLSEGSVHKNRITVYQKSPNPRMLAVLESTGLAWRWNSTPKASGWRLHHPVLACYLRQFGKAKDKFVPWHIKQMAPSAIMAFIEMYTLGDGHIRTRKNGAVEHTIFTTSSRMAGDMQELAQKAGWNSSLRIVKPQRSNLAGRTIVNSGGFSIAFKKSATRAELRKQNLREVFYDGMVYCLNVPHHTLYIRRNGKPSWTGNTPACVLTQVLPDGRWLAFDELQATSMGIDRFSDQVIEHCSRTFRGRATFEDYGDPAGNSRVQTDERTCFDIMRAKGIDIRGGEQDPTMRWESVKKPMNRLVNGEVQFVLHPRCKRLRKGFLGGYHFRRLSTSGERYSDRAEKNSYSHLQDALQYPATVLFGGILTAAPQERDDIPSAEDNQDFTGRSSVTGY